MNKRYLLDTNILSDLVRHPQGVIAEQIIRVGADTVCTSIIVSAELRFGAEKSHSTHIKTQLNAILSAIDILPMKSPIDIHYAEIRHHLENRGKPIGPNDLLIAAHAFSLDLTMVTANMREFKRVPHLRVENWLE